MSEFAQRIKKFRTLKGFTQRELANILNVSQNAVYNWENGKREPSIDMIEKIAQALDVKIVDLVDSIYMPDYAKTEEFAEMERYSNAFDGVIAILKSIYGDVTKHEYDYDHKDRLGYGTIHYYTVGSGQNKFILHQEDIRNLLNYAETSFPFIVNSLKDTRPEKEIIKDLCEKNEEILQGLIDGSIEATRIIDHNEE